MKRTPTWNWCNKLVPCRNKGSCWRLLLQAAASNDDERWNRGDLRNLPGEERRWENPNGAKEFKRKKSLMQSWKGSQVLLRQWYVVFGCECRELIWKRFKKAMKFWNPSMKDSRKPFWEHVDPLPMWLDWLQSWSKNGQVPVGVRCWFGCRVLDSM